MTDKLVDKLEILARLEELDRVTNYTTDREVLEYNAERKKALREALHSL